MTLQSITTQTSEPTTKRSIDQMGLLELMKQAFEVPKELQIGGEKGEVPLRGTVNSVKLRTKEGVIKIFKKADGTASIHLDEKVVSEYVSFDPSNVGLDDDLDLIHSKLREALRVAAGEEIA